MSSDQKSAQVVTLIIILIIAVSIIFGTYNLVRNSPKSSPHAQTRSDHQIFFPNIMIQSGSLKTRMLEENEFTISGKFIFLNALSSTLENWSLWLSLDSSGDTVISNVERGRFTDEASYPAPAKRNSPIPYLDSNEGLLLKNDNLLSNDFKLNAQVPVNICNVYLNYKSEYHQFTPFYQINLCN